MRDRVAKGMINGDHDQGRARNHGDPGAIRLKADRTVLAADNPDVNVLNIAVLDGQGRVAPVADHNITIPLKRPGTVIRVGDGDSSSYEPD